MTKNKILIIGAGISGCVLAERYANLKNKEIIIIDKRDHVGGNCYDYTNNIGLRVNKYGPHYFRTNNEEVWQYVQKFSEWRPFEARCLSHVDGKKVPLPVNIDTINMIFGTKIKTGAEMKKFLSQKEVSKTLYEKMFKNYTIKQWDKDPEELDPSVMGRIPIHFNHDNRYFTDKYQMYPIGGFTKIFEQMLASPNIEVKLNTNWDDVKNQIDEYEKIFFTGRIDHYFDYKLGKLEYRSLRFEEINLDQEWFQECVQENYPDTSIPFTRIVEYKYQTGQANSKTTIVKEYPTWEGEPYYPVLSQNNMDIYKKYEEKAELLKEKNVYFVGRLANYKYFNMDEAFKNALDLFNKIEND
jgi:UDP-galactopyranose mutase